MPNELIEKAWGFDIYGKEDRVFAVFRRDDNKEGRYPLFKFQSIPLPNHWDITDYY